MKNKYQEAYLLIVETLKKMSLGIYFDTNEVCNAVDTIKISLNRLEQLEKENQKLRKRETPIILHGVGIEEDVFYGICDICGSPNRLAEHYDHKQQKWIKQGYCIHCGQKYDWSDKNE